MIKSIGLAIPIIIASSLIHLLLQCIVAFGNFCVSSKVLLLASRYFGIRKGTYITNNVTAYN